MELEVIWSPLIIGRSEPVSPKVCQVIHHNYDNFSISIERRRVENRLCGKSKYLSCEKYHRPVIREHELGRLLSTIAQTRAIFVEDPSLISNPSVSSS